MAHEPSPKKDNNGERTNRPEPEYYPHPFNEIFPPMSPEEREELQEDIKKHGLKKKIIVDKQNRIMDGLNRYRACLTVGVVPEFEVFEGTEEEIRQFIWRENWIHRHLDKSQKAAVLADRQQLERGQHPSSGNSAITTEELAKEGGISVSSVGVARAIKRASADLHEAVKIGAIALNGAESIARKAEPERQAAIADLQSSIKDKGVKATRREYRKQANVSGNTRKPASKIAVIGINPLTNKLEPLVGYYANVMSVARAIPLLAAELRALPDHTTHQKLSTRHAKALLDAIQPVQKVDFDDIKASISDAVKHLRGFIKNDAAAGKSMDIIDAVELLAEEM